jgi:hypothetical protein
LPFRTADQSDADDGEEDSDTERNKTIHAKTSNNQQVAKARPKSTV